MELMRSVRLAFFGLGLLIALADGVARAQEVERSIRIVVVDAEDGKTVEEFQVLAGVPFNRMPAEGLEVVNWQAHTIRVGKDGEYRWSLARGYQEMALRVEAKGYVPQRQVKIMRGREPEVMEYQLIKDAGVAVRVLRPDGRPAAGATVGVSLPGRELNVKGGLVEVRGLRDTPADRWREPELVKADAEGKVRVPTESDPASVVLVLHETGVAEMAFAALKGAPEIKLHAWGKVDGRVLWQGKPGSGEALTLGLSRDYAYPGLIGGHEEARTDEQGRFVFEKVVPGLVQISRPIAVGDGGAGMNGITSVVLPGMFQHVRIDSGVTPVMFGGQGRKVTARLSGPATGEGVSVRFHPTAPHIGMRGDDAGWAAFAQFQKSELGPMFFREVKPDAAGRVEISGVLPGRYQLIVSGPGGMAGSVSVEVPPEKAGEVPVAVDAGVISVAVAPR